MGFRNVFSRRGNRLSNDDADAYIDLADEIGNETSDHRGENGRQAGGTENHWQGGEHIHIERMRSGAKDKHIPTEQPEKRITKLISGFLIVTEKHMPIYYFASEQSNKSLEASNKVYSGCGRSWDYWLPDNAPLQIKKLIKKAEETFSQNLMYSLLSSREEAETVLDWLNNSEDEFSYSLLEIYSDKTPDSTAIKHSGFIGVDIDCNGYYPIKEELFASKLTSSMHVEFDEFFELLNNNGLFDSYLDAKKFMDCYLRIQMNKNIEKLSEVEISYSFIHEIK